MRESLFIQGEPEDSGILIVSAQPLAEIFASWLQTMSMKETHMDLRSEQSGGYSLIYYIASQTAHDLVVSSSF